MPKTKLGKYAAICLGLLVAFLLIGNLFVASGQERGDAFSDNLLVSIPMTLAGLSGIAAFVFGLFALFKSKDRSVLVILAALVGLVIVFFLAGELFFPEH